MSLAAAVLLCGMAAAQGTVYGVAGLQSTRSILRQLDAQQAVIYTTDGNSSAFCLADFSTMTLTHAELPSNADVQDFEILNGLVYFCGIYANHPYIGHFDIAQLFGGTGDYYFCGLFPAPTSGQITYPHKLDVFTAAGENHVVVVGESQSSAAAGLIPTTFVMDFVTNLNGTYISAQFVQDSGNVDHFDDVAVTDDYVVTIENKTDGNAHYMRLYDRPVAAGQNIFSTSLWNTYYYSQGIYFPESDFLVRHLSGNTFATVCHTNSYGQHGAAYSVYDGSNLLFRYYTPQGTALGTGWKLNELSYNQYSQALSLLQDMDLPSTGSLESAVCQTDPANSTWAYHIDGMVLNSICPWDTDGSMMTSGSNGLGELMLWHQTASVGDCEAKEQLAAVSLPDGDQKSDTGYIPESISHSYIQVAPFVTSYSIAVECQ